MLSSLARRGLQTSVPTGTGEGGFPVFAVTSGGRAVTSEMVRAAQDDEA